MSKIVDYERLEPIPASYGYAGIVLSVAFFQTLNQTVLRIGCPKAVGRENYWKWRNLVVSWMHALIVGVWDITWYVGRLMLVADRRSGGSCVRNTPDRLEVYANLSPDPKRNAKPIVLPPFWISYSFVLLKLKSNPNPNTNPNPAYHTNSTEP